MRRLLTYKVELYTDKTYQILRYASKEDDFNIPDFDKGRIVEFQGTITECNAWLQLHDKGYL